ncbi:SDR family oxidoreductase [Kaistia dalseonensis]|uniref:Oxidoreductase n=1 Tax=Kaistia dalseonensis TaxID=410840 RepID=A0ABU0H514_9HYPH|nr:SDR family oxidoreductase [Kaistia dalseonensis]MCX5494824.1 SDR family oxidoreductase [Kaistia dalseonensis]MDQ0437405.1 putative oxidoreductase [Kaistia dalseonensis]
MKTTGNTILITGGGSGIGQALAVAFQALGNQVIIAGRRQSALDETVAAHPGLHSVVLDIEDHQSIRAVATELAASHPSLNVVIHNAGIMRPEDLLAQPDDLTDAEATVATNLLGPIRLTAALLPHLLKQEHAAILTVSSGLAFLPIAATPTYCATKAAIHSYSQSLRYQLRNTAIQVHEIVPPYVQTELMGPGQASDPDALPLKDFIDETMRLLQADPHADEILVERVKPLRFAEVDGRFGAVFDMLNGGGH